MDIDTHTAFIIAAATLRDASERPLSVSMLAECRAEYQRIGEALEVLEVTAIS